MPQITLPLYPWGELVKLNHMNGNSKVTRYKIEKGGSLLNVKKFADYIDIIKSYLVSSCANAYFKPCKFYQNLVHIYTSYQNT